MIRFQTFSKKSENFKLLNKLKLRRYSIRNEVQLTEPVEYPKIEDLSPRAELLRKKEAYYKKFEKLKTVEEKLFSLNLPKYYGWPAFILKEGVIPYDYLPLSQFITRSVISEDEKLPTNLGNDTAKELLSHVKSELEKVLVFEHNAKRFKHELERKFVEETKEEYLSPVDINDIKLKHLIKQVNNAIVRVLSSQYQHLYSAQVDYEPRLEAFWRVGGFYATATDCKLRKEKNIHESLIEDPIDRFFQYFGKPILQLRSKIPLPALPKIKLSQNKRVEDVNESKETFISDSKNVNSEISNDEKGKNSEKVDVGKFTNELSTVDSHDMAEVNKNYFYPLQQYRYQPDVYLEIPRERMHGSVIPGFWPNDPHRFGILSYHSRNHIMNRDSHYGLQEHKEAIHAQALLASFAWSYGLACYQGFSTYNDITYPFTTQTIITDGKLFSFYQYQLNTVVLHTDNTESHNPLYNECYATPSEELYHNISVDRVEGWNDKTLLNLLEIYLNVPKIRDSIDLCPYLDKEQKVVSLIEDNKRRIWFHNHYRHLMSHRSRHRLAPEIYDWERIYKVENKRRVTDARKRFFEKFEDPINDRKLSDHSAPYVPKKFREPGRLRHEKFADQFYPDVYPDYHEIV